MAKLEEPTAMGDVAGWSSSVWVPWLAVNGRLAAEEAMPGLPGWAGILAKPAEEGVAIGDLGRWASVFTRLSVTGGLALKVKPPIWDPALVIPEVEPATMGDVGGCST